MEQVKCDFCSSDVAEFLFSKKEKFGISDCDFNVVQCRNCGLIYVNPRPSEDEIGKFYPDTYSWKKTLTAESVITKFVRKLEEIYRNHLLNYEASKVVKVAKRKTGKLLDVGCGTGDRLNIFRRFGFETYGVEISSSAEYAKEYYGLNVKQGDLFDAKFPDSYFDIITLHNVLEHTHSPKNIIKELHRILKEDGIAVIQVPNNNSIQFKLFKERWAAVDVPRDLYYFNVPLLGKLLEQEKFKVVKVDHFNSFWHPPTLVITLFPALDPQKAWTDEKKGGNPLLKRLLWVFWTFALAPVAFLENLSKREAIFTIYAKKD